MTSINTSYSNPYLQQAQQGIEQATSRISSGRALQSAADDAAGLAIASGFQTNIGGFDQAARNTTEGISLAQTAGGALDSINSNLSRIRELAVQAGNGALNDTDRQAINTEAQQLRGQIQSVVDSSSFNGVPLLSREQSLSIQAGTASGDTIDINTADINQLFADSGFSSFDLSTQAGAEAALEGIDTAQAGTLQLSSDFGAVINRFESTVDSLGGSRIAAEASRSRIEDADLAKESSDLIKNQILSQASVAIQGQANQQATLALRLLS